MDLARLKVCGGYQTLVPRDVRVMVYHELQESRTGWRQSVNSFAKRERGGPADTASEGRGKIINWDFFLEIGKASKSPHRIGGKWHE
jgi:hypothetical protein